MDTELWVLDTGRGAVNDKGAASRGSEADTEAEGKAAALGCVYRTGLDPLLLEGRGERAKRDTGLVRKRAGIG